MEPKLGEVEFTVESDIWNTLWLVQKTLKEGRKKEAKVRIEIREGSVESTISLVAAFSTIGSFLLALATYIRSRREHDKPIEIIRASRDAAYAFSLHHLRTEANAPRALLVSERSLDDGFFFEFEDANGNRHTYTITRNLDVRYSRGS